ncbi:ABC transporter ATP-binding protein [Dehalobacterium formicoaceticum]|uniref:ABC transporter ATP-binding protein n=1 Tax=Dehalobacterium formicoaceticum TaxID=51515 RepID=A0ABT1Y7R7_9FIRM|nr:ABC transporter ATP-binding protein [Dehalobacterium formicoaceticum]MCR6546929.1 ABC transporter ATP-binding protein [Dehalobacterium formicoaceticum]
MILKVENLSYYYDKSKIIFKNANFSLHKGDILTILGPNGAGKSTMLNCLTNVLKPKSGQILIEGQNIVNMNFNEIARKIGYVPQIHIPTFGFTVTEFVTMGLAPKVGLFAKPTKKDILIAEKIMDKMEIYHLRNKPYTQISGGERQKATIAKVLVQDPKIIILDEPTAHLDFGNQHKTVGLVRDLAKEGYTVIMTTHQPNHAIMLDSHTAIINSQGEFLFGKTRDIVSEGILSNMYGMAIKMPYVDEIQQRVVCATG